MEKEFSMALTEALEVIKYMSEEDRKAIPKEFLEAMEEEKSKDYNFALDKNQKWNLQIRDMTKAVLYNLFIDYWATDYERKVIAAKEYRIRMDIEEEKRKKYPVDNIFKKFSTN